MIKCKQRWRLWGHKPKSDIWIVTEVCSVEIARGEDIKVVRVRSHGAVPFVVSRYEESRFRDLFCRVKS